MALLSQADVGSALQIFFNLQTLPEVHLEARHCHDNDGTLSGLQASLNAGAGLC